MFLYSFHLALSLSFVAFSHFCVLFHFRNYRWLNLFLTRIGRVMHDDIFSLVWLML